MPDYKNPVCRGSIALGSACRRCERCRDELARLATASKELPVECRSEFQQELSALINRHSKEGGSDTPDFILARYLQGCLELFDSTIRQRETWYGHKAVQPPTEIPLPT